MAGVAPEMAGSISEPRYVLRLSSLGSEPVVALARLVPHVAVVDLESSPALFRSDVDEACGGRPVLLVVDNVGELITRCSDRRAREKFAEAIASLVTGPRHHSAILIVGDESVNSISKLDALKPYTTPTSRFSPPPLAAAEIRRVLLTLSHDAGVRMAPGVADDLANELQGDVAALSMTRFMLLQLWSRSKGGLLDWDAYKDLGRPNDALDRVAEKTFGSLSLDEQSTSQRLFLKLAKPKLDSGAISLRRSIKRLIEEDEHPLTMDKIIKIFEYEGLLRRSAPGQDIEVESDDGLEIIHDNLMFHWKRLVSWLDEERQNSAEELRILAAVDLWQKSRKGTGYLFTDRDWMRKASRCLVTMSVSNPRRNALNEFLEASLSCPL